MYASRRAWKSRQGRRPAARQRGADGGRDDGRFRPLSEKYHDVVTARCTALPSPPAPLLRVGGPSAARAPFSPASTACAPHPPVRDEGRRTLHAGREGVRPLEYMARLGWPGEDVWFAHGIHFNNEELRVLAKTHTGVAHCPISNMKLASGVARIPEMLALGVPVGLAVDGQPRTTAQVCWRNCGWPSCCTGCNASPSCPPATTCSKWPPGAARRLLGRDDIGQLTVGKCADLFMIDSRRLELVGCDQTPPPCWARWASAAGGLHRGPGPRHRAAGPSCHSGGGTVAAEANAKCRAYLANV